jgi:hypothetical protein
MNSCFDAGNEQNTAGVKPVKHVRAAPRTCSNHGSCSEWRNTKKETNGFLMLFVKGK